MDTIVTALSPTCKVGWLDAHHESTVCEMLKRHGLITAKPRRRAIGHPGRPSSVVAGPNDCWSADFKGQFGMGNGLYTYPLTVTDNYSRYLLGCKALTGTLLQPTKTAFTRLFKEYGLPRRIRTDNGVPFAAATLGRLSQLSVWWLRLGVMPELIQPGKPQQNGRHERMHKTLKDETTKPPGGNSSAQQRKFNYFRAEFNDVRPHEALDMNTAYFSDRGRPFQSDRGRCFSVIVDGWGSRTSPGLNVAQSSTISLKRPAVAPASVPVLGLD